MNKHIGSSLESLLDERGIRDEVDLLTHKKGLAEELRRSMEAQQLTQSALAGRMETSRTVVHRLLDPADTSVTLATIAKASAALGMDLTIHLVAHDTKAPDPSKGPVRRERKKKTAVASRGLTKARRRAGHL